MPNTLSVIKSQGKNKILLRLEDPYDWPIAQMLAGKVTEVSPGYFEYALSVQNLERIYGTFTGPKRPQVVEGSGYVDRLRTQLIEYRRRLRVVRTILSEPRFPVEPNGKFHPYAHQTLGIGVILANPYAPVMLSCGLGKTGTAARAVEICLERKEIRKGKVLVSAPLSILEPSWLADIEKFTHLKAGVLWTSQSNKNILGEHEDLGSWDQVQAPEGMLSRRKKEEISFYNPDLKQLRKKPNTLERAANKNWIRYEVSYSVATLADGTKVPFGPIRGRQAKIEDRRTAFILDQLRNPAYDLFLINHDGVRIYEEELKAHGFEWVIVDESTKIKSIKSKVTQAHINISWSAKRRNPLSGTPNPNGFEDLWSQYYFADRGLTLGTALADFRHDYFIPEVIGTYDTPQGVRQQKVRFVFRSHQDREALIQVVKAPGIFMEQRDCIDLPPRTDMVRAVSMTPEQESAYADMEDELVAELGKGDLYVKSEAVNSLAKIMKLRQITSGFLKDVPTGWTGKIDSPKLADLDDFLEELGGQKIVLACQFREEIEQLLSRYRDRGIAAVYGGVSVNERTQAIHRFQTTDDLQIMVLQPQAAAHGITLTAAAYLMYLSLDYNFEYYYQVAKRIERIGQKSSMFVLHSVARFRDGTPTIDEDLMEVLRGKNQERDMLFQAGQVSVEEVVSLLHSRIQQRHRNRNR